MNSYIARLCVAILGCFLVKTTYGAWTVPVIATTDGSAAVANAVDEGETTTFPQLASTGANNYVITAQTPDAVFEITAATGQLALAAGKSLDYETDQKHVLTVKADDGTNTATATVTININDVNDNAPAFPTAMYSVCLADATASGATVLTVSTTDADSTTAANTISAMSIAAGDTNTDFAISAAGVITTAKALSMSTKAGYALQVEAADSDTGTKLTGTTTVYVIVADACGGCSGVAALAASLVTLFVALMTSSL